MFYMNAQGDQRKYRQVYADNNVYAIAPLESAYLRSANDGLKLQTFADWQKDTAQDGASQLVEPAAVPFVSYTSGDFDLTHNPWPGVAPLHDKKVEGVLLDVYQDFNGTPRDKKHPTVGAFEAPVKR